MSRREFVTPGNCEAAELQPGFFVRVLTSGGLGAEGLTTCVAEAKPGAGLPYHTHPTGEAITVLRGEADLLVEGRVYRLKPYDCIHIPAQVAHGLRNPSSSQSALVHTSFPTAAVEREFAEDNFEEVRREAPEDSHPECVRRSDQVDSYELGAGVVAWDLFAGRFGAAGMCGGLARFSQGAGLPCHHHDYDESITIVEGAAICQVAGERYHVEDFSTACVPRRRAHRFWNESPAEMAMIWVYAGDEPDRELVAAECCETAQEPSARN